MSCTKKHYDEKKLKTKKLLSENPKRTRENYLKNRYEISIRHNGYIKNGIKTDVSFHLIHNTRRRIHHALNGKSKSSSTVEFLGNDIESYERWIDYQFTLEMNWLNTEIDYGDHFDV